MRRISRAPRQQVSLHEVDPICHPVPCGVPARDVEAAGQVDGHDAGWRTARQRSRQAPGARATSMILAG
jgi:hypothetical protein